jgi:hypothetical protein
VIQAALDLSGPGGLVALVGSAARHAAGLAALMDGVHVVATNAPPDVAETAVLSLLAADGEIPLRDAVVRGAVVGAEAAGDAWLAEAGRQPEGLFPRYSGWMNSAILFARTRNRLIAEVETVLKWKRGETWILTSRFRRFRKP